jgi:hypothetical protein
MGNWCWLSSRRPLNFGLNFLGIDSADVGYLLGSDAEEVQRSSALFILKLKEKFHVSQVAIDAVVEGSRMLFAQVLQRVKAGVRAKLAQVGLDAETIGLEDVYKNIVDPFDGINTCHLQEKYFREKLDLIVSNYVPYQASR